MPTAHVFVMTSVLGERLTERACEYPLPFFFPRKERKQRSNWREKEGRGEICGFLYLVLVGIMPSTITNTIIVKHSLKIPTDCTCPYFVMRYMRLFSENGAFENICMRQ